MEKDVADKNLVMQGDTRSAHDKVVAIACAVLAAVLVLTVWHPWGAGDSSDGGEASTSEPTVSAEAVSNEWTDDKALLLSSWTDFGDFWEERDEAEATYAETLGDGSTAWYRIKDGCEAGRGVKADWIFEGGAETDAVGDWRVAAVNCSTGEISWWRPTDAVLGRIESAAPGVLESQGLRPYGAGWVAYTCLPPQPKQSADSDETATLLRTYYGRESQEVLGNDFADPTSTDEFKRAIVYNADDDLYDYLLLRFGDDAVNKYPRKGVADE